MQTSNVPPELLDLDLSSIDTSFTVIKAGFYDLVVKESDVAENKDKTGNLWTLKLATTRATTDIKGNEVKEGHVLYHRVSLAPTDNYNHEAVAKNAARFIQACKPQVTGITAKDLFNGDFNTKCKVFAGRMLQAKVEALPEGVDKKTSKMLPPRNEISQLVKA